MVDALKENTIYINELEKNRNNDAEFFKLLNSNETKLENCLSQLGALNNISIGENKKVLNKYTGQLLKQGIGSLREKYLKNVEETNNEKPVEKVKEKSVKKEKVEKEEKIFTKIESGELTDIKRLKIENLQLRKKNEELSEQVSNLESTLEQ